MRVFSSVFLVCLMLSFSLRVDASVNRLCRQSFRSCKNSRPKFICRQLKKACKRGELDLVDENGVVNNCKKLYERRAKTRAGNRAFKKYQAGRFSLVTGGIGIPFSATYYLASSITTKAEKVFIASLANDLDSVAGLSNLFPGNKLNRIFRKLKRKNPGRELNEIGDAIDEGFESNLFCKKYPRLRGLPFVKRYVKNYFEHKNNESVASKGRGEDQSDFEVKLIGITPDPETIGR